ncbi:hypothetical protein [Candidatus Hakubella thermalkaliphila]|uniref:hypothetical protein n=1 Tax=Candidatus Hakubella thermalkaliphila TaxID=2754717 RepID=UPI0015934747|nr:hypothetical protein [Candidatus Hakubella thermalkaliphila]
MRISTGPGRYRKADVDEFLREMEAGDAWTTVGNICEGVGSFVRQSSGRCYSLKARNVGGILYGVL